MPHPTPTPGLRSIHNACKLHETLTCPIPSQPQTWWCTFGAESRLGPFGGCFFTGGWPTGKKMNHQIMDRWAMLKYQAIHGKTFGLFLEFPRNFPGRFLFPKEQTGMDPKSVFSHDIFSLLNYLYKMLDLCTFGAESRLGPFGGCFFYRWVTNR